MGGMWYSQDDNLHAMCSFGQVLLHPDVFEIVLISEEPSPGLAHSRVDVLFFEFVPVIYVGVMDSHFRSHFGESTDDHFGPAVARISHVLSVAGPADQHLSPRYISSHIPQGVAG